jgi:putative addiction module CopG family antidote
MNISLRPELEELIKEKVQNGQYRSADDVFDAALSLLQERDHAEDHLERLLQEAEDSGAPAEMTPQDWNDIRREVHEHHQQQRKAG